VVFPIPGGPYRKRELGVRGLDLFAQFTICVKRSLCIVAPVAAIYLKKRGVGFRHTGLRPMNI
jgi:hypothetical protein